MPDSSSEETATAIFAYTFSPIVHKNYAAIGVSGVLYETWAPLSGNARAVLRVCMAVSDTLRRRSGLKL